MVARTCWMCPWMRSSMKMAWLSVFDPGVKLRAARRWSVIHPMRRIRWRKSVKSFGPFAFSDILSVSGQVPRLAQSKSSFLRNKCSVAMVRLLHLLLNSHSNHRCLQISTFALWANRIWLRRRIGMWPSSVQPWRPTPRKMKLEPVFNCWSPSIKSLLHSALVRRVFYGGFLSRFVSVSDLYEPIDDGTTSKVNSPLWW